jgi:CRP-like cAMP-binding protein
MDETLARLRILAGVGEPALDLLASHLQRSTHPAGTFIVRQDEPGHTLHIIESGRVEVLESCPEHPGPVKLAELGPGDYFGEMALIECRPRVASVRTLEEVRLASLRGTDLLRLYEAFPRDYSIVILNIARDLSRRVAALDRAFCARSG